MTDEQLTSGKTLQDRIKARAERIKTLSSKMQRAREETNAHYDLVRSVHECLTPDVDYHELSLIALLVWGIAKRRLDADEAKYAAL